MMQRLQAVIEQNPLLSAALAVCSGFSDERLYLAAGAVVQSVWNQRFRLPPSHGIADLDIVYCNNLDLSVEAELRTAAQMQVQLGHLDLPLDIKNQARVHLWYHAKFGYPIPALDSLEAAVRLWPTSATAIALRLDKRGQLEVLAPFGLDDLFAGIVRPNPRQIRQETYDRKVARWLALWPGLTIIPWSDCIE